MQGVSLAAWKEARNAGLTQKIKIQQIMDNEWQEGSDQTPKVTLPYSHHIPPELLEEGKISVNLRIGGIGSGKRSLLTSSLNKIKSAVNDCKKRGM